MNYIAVDLGASSGRIVLGRWGKQNIELTELHRFPNEPVWDGGHLRWDVLSLWQGIKHGLYIYSTQIGEPLAGMGVDSWGVDYALLDAAGQLLELPYHYRDKRTEGIAEQIWQRIGRAETFERTGIQFLPFNTLYQLYAHAQRDPSCLQSAARLLMIPDLFAYWLSGRQKGEYTNATTTQFWNVMKNDWDTELLDKLGVPTHFLPPVVLPGTRLGELLPEITQEVGLPPGVSIFAPATHDTASAVVAVPGLDTNSAYLSSGTWSLLGAEVAAPVLHAQSLNFGFTNEGGANGTFRLLKNISGLWLLQECQRAWQAEGKIYSWQELLALAASASPFGSLIDPDAPDFLSPPHMPQAIIAFCERTGQPSPADTGAIVRCCLESLALKYRYVLEQLEILLEYKLETIRVVGGGSQNTLLCQLTADACNRPVLAGPTEATTLGNLAMQAIASGHLPDLAIAREVIAASVQPVCYQPTPGNAQQAKWQAAYKKLVKVL
jgi:rhamnulokinase